MKAMVLSEKILKDVLGNRIKQFHVGLEMKF